MSARDAQRAALTRVRRSTRAREEADERWKEALRGAVAAGLSLRAIGEHAGITAMRVSQIVGPVDAHRKEKKR